MRRLSVVFVAFVALAAWMAGGVAPAQENPQELSGYRLLEDVVILQRLQQAQVTDAQIGPLLVVVQDYLAGRAGPNSVTPADDPLTKDVLTRGRDLLLGGQPLPADLDQELQQILQAVFADRQRTRQVVDYAIEQIKAILSEEQVAKLGEQQWGRGGRGPEQGAGPQDPRNRIADVLIDEVQKLKNLPDNEWEAALGNMLQQRLGQRLQPGNPMYEQLKGRITEVTRKIRGMTNADIEANREALRADVLAAIQPQQGPGGPRGQAGPAGPGRPGGRQFDPAELALRFLADYRTVRILELKASPATTGG